MQANAILEKRHREKTRGTKAPKRKFTDYAFDPYGYMADKLDFYPWPGTDDKPGQTQIVDAYLLALHQLHEKRDFENGVITRAQLKYWKPGQVIKNRLKIEGGHNTGKTILAAKLFSHFFDCFPPALIYSFAPEATQLNTLLWKYVRTDRDKRPHLPGTVMSEPYLKYKSDHFAIGRSTNDNKGTGTFRVHGQHGPYMMILIDEAVGVPDFVFDALESFMSGGIVIVIMMSNPQNRNNRFHREGEKSYVASFRMNCLDHPNVIEGRDIYPGGVTRDWVVGMLEGHCSVVDKHNEDNVTFELPFKPGTIYMPDYEYQWRVLGFPPKNAADKTFIPVGRYEAALHRAQDEIDDDLITCYLGVDVARQGTDYGTIYKRHRGRLNRHAQLFHQNTLDYAEKVKECGRMAKDQGAKKLHIRVDGTGGYGAGVIDTLRADIAFIKEFDEVRIFEVQFGASASNQKAYADLVTEMYGEAAETLKGVRVENAPKELEADLCEREWKHVNLKGNTVKKCEDKELFRGRFKRSPDDGDGAVLALAPPHIFVDKEPKRFGRFIPLN